MRKDLALWLCRNKRSAPYLSGPAAADFVESFTIPDTDFEMTQQYVDQNGEILVLFKTALHLCSWQTRNGKRSLDYTYYRVDKAQTDPDGTLTGYKTLGYIISDI